MAPFWFADAKVGIFFIPTNFSANFLENSSLIKIFALHLHSLNKTECSAVGSALRSGRRGRAFESPHSDKKV